MFHEYAIDPAVFTSFDRVRFFLDAMEPSTGRLLSQFPKDWWKHVVCKLPDGLRKQGAVERIIAFKQKMVRRKGHSFDPTASWVSNAMASNKIRPFRAIVTEAGNEADNHVCSETVDETTPLWQVPNEFVTRSAVDVTRTVGLLLQHVSAVVLIDPHVGKCRLTQRKLFVALAAEADENTQFEVYCVPLGVGENAKQGLRRNFEQLAQQSLRGSQKIAVTVLSECVGGARFHNRYLLSRIGGVQFGDTIEASDGEDSLSALSVAKIKTLNRDYCPATTAFTIEDTFTVSA